MLSHFQPLKMQIYIKMNTSIDVLQSCDVLQSFHFVYSSKTSLMYFNSNVFLNRQFAGDPCRRLACLGTDEHYSRLLPWLEGAM